MRAKTVNKNNTTPIYEEYRSVWITVAELKAKLLRLNDLKKELSKDRFNSLSKEYLEKLEGLEPKIEHLKQKADSQIKSSQIEIPRINNSLSLINKRISDIDLLLKNEIIDELQFLKEKKLLEKEHTELRSLLTAQEEMVANIKMVLKYPNPEDEAKATIELQKKERIEKEAKEKAEREAKELEDKKKSDIQYQIKKAEERIQAEAEKQFLKYEQLTNEKIKDLNGQKEGLAVEVNNLYNKNKELTSDLEIFRVKSAKYREKIDNLYTDLKETKYPCGDQSCEGFFVFEGRCKVCGLNFYDAQDEWHRREYITEIKRKIDKNNRKGKIIIFILSIIFLFSFISDVIEFRVIMVTIIIITLFVWKVNISGLKKKILAVDEYGLNDAGNYDVEKYSRELDELKAEIESVKKTEL